MSPNPKQGQTRNKDGQGGRCTTCCLLGDPGKSFSKLHGLRINRPQDFKRGRACLFINEGGHDPKHALFKMVKVIFQGGKITKKKYSGYA